MIDQLREAAIMLAVLISKIDPEKQQVEISDQLLVEVDLANKGVEIERDQFRNVTRLRVVDL